MLTRPICQRSSELVRGTFMFILWLAGSYILFSGLKLTYRTMATAVENDALPHKLAASVILNRSPFLTPSPTPFETGYYDYQARIARALHRRFPHDFYFKKGSVLERKFKIEERARDIDAFGGKRRAVNEEDEMGLNEEEEVFVPTPRESEADKTGDVKSLDRKGERNLYLLVKDARMKGAWQFPEGGVGTSEPLHVVCISLLPPEQLLTGFQ